MSTSYLEILNTQFSYGDRVFFLMNCYDRPNIFLRCFGIVKNKEIHKNNIRYHIQLVKILERQDSLLSLLQDQRIRTVKSISKRANLKKINLLKIISDFDFEEKLQKDFSNDLIVVNNFFCTRTRNEIDELFQKSNQISSEVINSLRNTNS